MPALFPSWSLATNYEIVVQYTTAFVLLSGFLAWNSLPESVISAPPLQLLNTHLTMYYNYVLSNFIVLYLGYNQY